MNKPKLNLSTIAKMALLHSGASAAYALGVDQRILLTFVREKIGPHASFWTLTHVAIMGYIYRHPEMSTKQIAGKLCRSEMMIARIRQKMGHVPRSKGGDRASAGWVLKHYSPS